MFAMAHQSRGGAEWSPVIASFVFSIGASVIAWRNKSKGKDDALLWVLFSAVFFCDCVAGNIDD
jgi:hypothetical protein